MNLVWLKIYSPAVVDAQSILTDSCAYTLESTPITDPKNFTVSYDSPKDNVHYMVHYDEKKPMAGFTITTTPMPK